MKLSSGLSGRTVNASLSVRLDPATEQGMPPGVV
jgi:hypothetical protein